MKTKTKKINKKISRFSWAEYIVTLVIMGILSALPGIMYGYETGVLDEIGTYAFWYIVYWGIVTAFFCLFTAYQKYRAFDEPMNQLSEATKKVAEGDFSVYLTPVHRSGHLEYMDAMYKDFNRMVQELGSLETMKTDFISSVSHEIKTPLAIIQSYAMALQKQHLTTEQQNEYTETIITASKSLTTLVTNILNLNKLENQGILPPAEPYNVCRQLSDCALSFESFWVEKEIDFIVDIEDRAYLHMEESMVEIIWRNLISNAIKFTNQGGTVKIEQTSTEEAIIVKVSDTGSGMSEKTKQHVFEKFYQGDVSRSKEGNGLGLALVWRVVELLDGEVSVESGLGTGTTFTVKLKVIE